MERALKFKYSLRTQTYFRLSLLSIHPKNNYKNNKIIFLVERSGDRKCVCVRGLIQMILTPQLVYNLYLAIRQDRTPPQASLSSLENGWENGERTGSDSVDSGSSSFFCPFLVLRLLTVSVTVQKVLPVEIVCSWAL